MTEERVPGRQVAFALLADGLMHAMSVVDDGICSTALCGATVAYKDAGDDDSVMCEPCIPLMAAELGLEPSELAEELRLVMGRKG